MTKFLSLLLISFLSFKPQGLWASPNSTLENLLDCLQHFDHEILFSAPPDKFEDKEIRPLILKIMSRPFGVYDTPGLGRTLIKGARSSHKIFEVLHESGETLRINGHSMITNPGVHTWFKFYWETQGLWVFGVWALQNPNAVGNFPIIQSGLHFGPHMTVPTGGLRYAMEILFAYSDEDLQRDPILAQILRPHTEIKATLSKHDWTLAEMEKPYLEYTDSLFEFLKKRVSLQSLQSGLNSDFVDDCRKVPSFREKIAQILPEKSGNLVQTSSVAP